MPQVPILKDSGKKADADKNYAQNPTSNKNLNNSEMICMYLNI